MHIIIHIAYILYNIHIQYTIIYVIVKKKERVSEEEMDIYSGHETLISCSPYQDPTRQVGLSPLVIWK